MPKEKPEQQPVKRIPIDPVVGVLPPTFGGELGRVLTVINDGYPGEVDWRDIPEGGISEAPNNDTIHGRRGNDNSWQPIDTIQGEKGDKGDTGDKGDDGSIGPEGPAGEQGDMGPEGPQGIQGIQGIQGVQGSQGVPGERGSIGPEGPRGEQGIDGARGEQGPKGEDGFVSEPPNNGTTHGRVTSTGGSSWEPVLSLSGGQMQGRLAVQEPTNDSDAASKGYVDRSGSTPDSGEGFIDRGVWTGTLNAQPTAFKPGSYHVNAGTDNTPAPITGTNYWMLNHFVAGGNRFIQEIYERTQEVTGQVSTPVSKWYRGWAASILAWAPWRKVDLPPGGDVNQVLTRLSTTYYDVGWRAAFSDHGIRTGNVNIHEPGSYRINSRFAGLPDTNRTLRWLLVVFDAAGMTVQEAYEFGGNNTTIISKWTRGSIDGASWAPWTQILLGTTVSSSKK